eukprot:s45_g27.t1
MSQSILESAMTHEVSADLKHQKESAGVGGGGVEVYPVRPARLSHFDLSSALLELAEKLEPGGAYSMGVEHHDQWSMDVYKTFHIPIFQYDCTVSGPAQNCDECYFFQACLKGQEDEDPFPGKRSWTLAEAVAESKKATAKERSLLLKMDIEGGEWPTLAGSELETLKKFRQLVIEFHGLNKEEKHELYLQVMQKLLKAGFKAVVHVHGNNYAGLYEKDEFRLPNVVEVTLDAMADPVSSSGACHDPNYEQLDMPNAPNSEKRLPCTRR